ncbi:hypothetical protein HDV01_007102 [Terramyces sp. JEL0728]|nr:hypothetical protein HDV01_007102 [Terramyces sp. JEL0728]
MILKAILIAFAFCKKFGGEYDTEESNYGNIKKSSAQFKKATGDENADDNESPFYFFSLHDYNKDGHLDGHELALAFQGYGVYDEPLTEEIPVADLEYMIEHTLSEDDINSDGKISWEEFLESQHYHHNMPSQQ